MGGLAHYIEKEGVPTTQISLVRLHTRKIRPPRALWVPFELGRPLGAPGDPQFQIRVLRSVLDLFNRYAGPVVLEDFPDDVTIKLNGSRDQDGRYCPVNLSNPLAISSTEGKFRFALSEEVKLLTPWFDFSYNQNKRTTVGLSGLSMAQIGELLNDILEGKIARYINDQPSFFDKLRFSIEDLKAFYRESAVIQPGKNTGHDINNWFYGETVAGRVLFALKPLLIKFGSESGDANIKLFGSKLLIPRSQSYRENKRSGTAE